MPGFSAKFTLREFIETKLAIRSRVFSLSTDSQRGMSAMVPFGDLMNHSNPPSVEWYWDGKDRRGVFWRAEEDIQSGDQVFGSYGVKSNLVLLWNYGFIDPENQEGVAHPLNLSLPDDAPLIDLKVGLLGQNLTDGGIAVDC